MNSDMKLRSCSPVRSLSGTVAAAARRWHAAGRGVDAVGARDRGGRMGASSGKGNCEQVVLVLQVAYTSVELSKRAEGPLVLFSIVRLSWAPRETSIHQSARYRYQLHDSDGHIRFPVGILIYAMHAAR